MGAGLNAWFIEEFGSNKDVKLKSYVINADGSKTSYSIESNRTAGGPVTIAKETLLPVTRSFVRDTST